VLRTSVADAACEWGTHGRRRIDGDAGERWYERHDRLKVTTGEGVAPIEVDRLAAGGRSEARAVSVLHSFPIVTLTTNGKQFTAHPIEGFIEGWNPSKAPGQYLIRLKVAPEYQVLDVRVVPAQ
jgi:hypothetical protein